MKERIQYNINRIKNIAGISNAAIVDKSNVESRPDNALSRSIRTEKEATQFKAELSAAIALGKSR